MQFCPSTQPWNYLITNLSSVRFCSVRSGGVAGWLPTAYCLGLIFSQLYARSRKLPEYREFLFGNHGNAEAGCSCSHGAQRNIMLTPRKPRPGVRNVHEHTEKYKEQKQNQEKESDCRSSRVAWWNIMLIHVTQTPQTKYWSWNNKRSNKTGKNGGKHDISGWNEHGKHYDNPYVNSGSLAETNLLEDHNIYKGRWMKEKHRPEWLKWRHGDKWRGRE